MSEALQMKRASRNLVLFTGSEFIGTIGSSIYMFGIGLFVLGLTGSATNFALTMLCSMVPRILLSPVAGHLVDRWPKKIVAVISHALMALTMAIVLSYTLAFELSLPLIYGTAAMLAIFATFAGISLTASIANFVDENRIQRAVSLTQSSNSLAAILGPIAGGVMFGFFSIEVFLICHALAYSIVTLLVANMHFNLFRSFASEDDQPEEQLPMLTSIKEGALYVKNHPLLFAIMTVALWVNFFFMASAVGLPFIFVEVLEGTSNQLGVVQSMLGAGTLLTSIYLSTRKEIKKPIKTVRGGLLFISLALGLMAIPLLISMPNLGFAAFYMGIALLMGVLMVIVNTPIQVLLHKTTPDHYKGRVFGLIEMLASGISPLGIVLFGFLYDSVSPQWILIVSAALLFLVTLYGMRPSRVKDTEPKTEVKEELAETLSS
ncbi:MFS transporter [Jeotgalibacillus proteolyticus]|uniref:MFS transporter n=1 Tax=Jeotgalibacillus proteolyticus TaxID=2082395 RepID=A0A2S5GAA9_9BACL|nr:MFS transporter [Jeotgalibacillus proteolyticus]PPA69919.1 MFS transporter [Jeotgalibacillus proteolyticus]